MSTDTPVCPICGGPITLAPNVEVSEIITCHECGNRVMVEAVSDGQAVLKEAPKVEEDWGQ